MGIGEETFTRLLNFHTITFSGSFPKKCCKRENALVEITPPGHSAYCNRVKVVGKVVGTRAFSGIGGERKILTQL